jgi:hypothetical protein
MGRIPPEEGSDYQLHSRIVAFDPLAQNIQCQIRTLLWRDGQVIAQYEYTLSENLYFRNEFRQMLEQAGFEVEAIQGDYSEADAAPENDVTVFKARR